MPESMCSHKNDIWITTHIKIEIQVHEHDRTLCEWETRTKEKRLQKLEMNEQKILFDGIKINVEYIYLV